MIKRLHYYLSKTENKTTNYRYNTTVDGKLVQRELYDAEVYVLRKGRVVNKDRHRSEPTFWYKDIAYTIARTNKLAQDRPTFTIAIPVEKLGFTQLTDAAADYCLRAIKPYFDEINARYANISRPDRDNGKFYIYEPCAKVLKRNTAFFADQYQQDYEEVKDNIIIENPEAYLHADVMCLHIRLEVQLPYQKRDRAISMLCKEMPDAVERFIEEFNVDQLQQAITLEKKQNEIRKYLSDNGYSAFIANGSILARDKGDKPALNSLPFLSPKEQEIEIFDMKGLGIKNGVTVITGGGYSGKSTVLNAISAGIYNHIAGDGRECCITCDTAVTITAEDGRAVNNVNISPFIKWIPSGEPESFCTDHASGSTSQGANIMEAVAWGSKLLLIDEDRSATNFMIRDELMKSLIKKEPITPFTERVQEIANMGTSTILVIGGSGEYLSVAHTVLLMDEYKMMDVTASAKQIAKPMGESVETPANWLTSPLKITTGFSSYPKGKGREKLHISDTGFIHFGDERIDVRNLHDVATENQVNALAFMLRYMSKNRSQACGSPLSELERLAMVMRGLDRGDENFEQSVPAENLVMDLYEKIAQEGMDIIDTSYFAGMNRFLDLPRPFELLGAIRRMRHITIE